MLLTSYNHVMTEQCRIFAASGFDCLILWIREKGQGCLITSTITVRAGTRGLSSGWVQGSFVLAFAASTFPEQEDQIRKQEVSDQIEVPVCIWLGKAVSFQQK